VSRVVAGNGYVSEAKRRAIDAAIAELGYRPNSFAQALRSNRSNMIGTVVVDVGTTYFSNVVYGIQRATRAAGKSLLVSSGYADRDEEARAVIELVDRSCDGIVVYLERPMRPDVIEIVRRAGIPMVSIGRNMCPQVARGTVMLNNFDGAFSAMRHLLEQGHRRIVHLTGQPDFGDTIARLQGVAAALTQFGMTMDEIHVVSGEYSQDFGYAATAEMLREGRDFTAIFAGDDDMAAGVLAALRDGGRRVPDDVSLIGFDDTFHARHLWPPLTTVRQPTAELGEAAAEMLLELLAEPGRGPLETIVQTSLVLRSSVGAAHRQRQVA
jgi:LacI family transcriptional regulator